METPRGPSHGPDQPPARYLVIIDSASEGTRLARLFLADRTEVAQFGASAPEVQLMTQGLAPGHDGAAAAWDLALGGHADGERAAADVYTLDL